MESNNPSFSFSHILSDQAMRWGIMDLELYTFVYCVKQLTPYLMAILFTVKMIQEPFISRILRFQSWWYPHLESPPFRVQISHPAHPGRAKRCGRRTHWSHESLERGNSRVKASYVHSRPYPSTLSFGRGRDEDRRNPRKH